MSRGNLLTNKGFLSCLSCFNKNKIFLTNLPLKIYFDKKEIPSKILVNVKRFCHIPLKKIKIKRVINLQKNSASEINPFLPKKFFFL